MSLPAWGAWVETLNMLITAAATSASLPAWGAWVETDPWPLEPNQYKSRSPHGERGLKLLRKDARR